MLWKIMGVVFSSNWVLMFKCTINKLTVEVKLLMEELKVDTVKNWNSVERIDTVHIDLRIIM